MAYPNYYSPYFPNYQQQQQPQQIQNGGFIPVANMEAAYNYPVAPGNSITFKDENAPYVYTKTKGFSPLDQPVFEKYRLVKEDDIPAKQPESNVKAVDYDDQIKSLWNEINALKTQISGMETKEEKPTRKRKESTDEQ